VEFGRLLETLGSFRKPLIGAVNGLAVGFGATLLAYCDLVLMAENAQLRFPFTELGIVPEAGSSTLLYGRGHDADLTWAMLASAWIDAPTAMTMGLVWRVLPDDRLAEMTAHAASTLAALNPASVMATKRLLTAGRADNARAAIDRELHEMSALFDRHEARS
jgi:enoyl-CoA hydratase/carnithine racemase